MKIEERGQFTIQSLIPYYIKNTAINITLLIMFAVLFSVFVLLFIYDWNDKLAFYEVILGIGAVCVFIMYIVKYAYRLIMLKKGKILVDTDRVVDMKSKSNGNVKNGGEAKIILSRYNSITLSKQEIDFVIGEDVYVIALDNKRKTVIDLLSKKHNRYLS